MYQFLLIAAAGALVELNKGQIGDKLSAHEVRRRARPTVPCKLDPDANMELTLAGKRTAKLPKYCRIFTVHCLAQSNQKFFFLRTDELGTVLLVMLSRRVATKVSRSGEQGGARTIVLVMVFFLLGLLVSAFLFRQPPRPPVTANPQGVDLSEPSRTLLARLEQPVEIRFYSLLDPGSELGLRTFSDRVERLLVAYSQNSMGKVTFVPQTNLNANAAVADGIKGFNLDKGEGCYLGIAFSCAGKKEVLPQLSRDWESALEADVSRAIQRVSDTASRPKLSANSVKEDKALIEQIQAEIPNLASLSLEEAIRAVRENSVKAFTETVSKMNELVQEATTDYVKAQKQGSTADQQEALKKLQAVQATETEMLKQVAAESQLRIEAVRKLKAGGK